MFKLQLFSKLMQQTVRMCFRWKKMEARRSSRPHCIHAYAWLPPGSFSGYCRRYLPCVVVGVGVGWGLWPPTVRKFSIIPQICQIRPLIHVSVSVTRCYSLRIQEGCQDAQKLRRLEVYHFCNIFKHTVRAMRSSLQTRALAIQKNLHLISLQAS